MLADTQYIPAPLARWSSRLGVFALVLVLTAGVLHRAAGLPTAVTLNLFKVGFGAAALAILAGLVAVIQIWRGGRTGAWNVAWGLIVSAGLFLWPAISLQTARGLPAIYDISTDLANPPKFNALAKGRGPGAHPASYPGEAFAREQLKAYPDLRAVTVDRPADEAFEIVAELLRGRRGLGWKIASEEPPGGRNGRIGMIEAVDRTMILGFYDDIAIRIEGSGKQSRIDIRSASRFGQHDLGQNASRIRRFVRELQTRLDLALPGTVASRGVKDRRAATLVPKRKKGEPPVQAARKGGSDRARPDAQRARAQRERLRE